MYQVEANEKSYRTSPWNKEFKKRIGEIKAAKEYNKRTIAFLYPKFDSSTFRYRGYNVSETLEYSFNWSGACFEVEEHKELLEYIKYIDVVVFIRCAWSKSLDKFIKKIKSCGIKTIYDIDDLVYHPKYAPIVLDTLGIDNDFEDGYWFGLLQRHYALASQCDGFISTNDFLAEKLREDMEKPVYIIQNYLNWTQEMVSEDFFEKKMRVKTENPFVIGYFSGSPTHVKDLMVVMPELETFLEKHDDSVLRIVGYMNLPDKYSYLVTKGRIEFVNFQTFIGLQHEQAKVDINIVPLLNNVFSNCKSELKYFESAIVGTITCATPTYTYRNAIVNGDNGYLCNKGDWLPAFEEIYAEGVSKEKMQYIRKKALDRYGNKKQVYQVEDVFDRIMEIEID